MKGRDNTGCGEVHLCVLANDARRGVCESSSERKIVGYSVIGFRVACCIHTNIRRENAEMDAGIVLHHAGTVTVCHVSGAQCMNTWYDPPLWLGRLSIPFLPNKNLKLTTMASIAQLHLYAKRK